jgi:hypothetical protein
MSHKRLTTWQKATALVPLALLSGAWTASLTVTGTASAQAEESRSTLPDGTVVPDDALEAPASLSRPGSLAPGVPDGAAEAVIADASTDGIPAAALAAYQRAEQVINSADDSCNLSWQLLAAIGRVESDHGRFGGNVLGEGGRSRPGIYGIPLDGSDGTARIEDTDAGDLDDDAVWDRAVGPMQFIPSTWSVVGVDGDGDGVRDPQDIDDAALAGAVYLCSGDEDLSTYGGQKAAVYRYNHSQDYVNLVVAIMNAYLEGDFTSVPTGVAASTIFTPSYTDAVVGPGTTGARPAGSADRDARTGSSPTGSGDPGGSTGGTAPACDRDGDDGDGGAGGAGDGGTTAPSVPDEEEATGDPAETVDKTVKETTDTVEETTEEVTGPVDDATGGSLTYAEAKAQCVESGVSPLDPAALKACIAGLLD